MLGALVLALAVTAAPAPSPSPTPVPPAAPVPFVLRVLRLAAHDVGISARLLRSVAAHESAFRSNAVSKAGAVGLLQTLPSTAVAHGCAKPFDATCNAYAGARYLASLLRRFHGDRRLALAAYNAGPATVDHFHGVPPYPETRAYVAGILADVASDP